MITRVSSDEWELLRTARLAALLDSPDAFGVRYDEDAAANESTWRSRTQEAAWFVAMTHDAPSGVVALTSIDPATRNSTVLTLDPVPLELKVYGMWVRNDLRGTRLATQLIARCAEFARNAGVAYLTLGVFDDNTRAMRFYERCGFTTEGTARPSSARPGHTFFDMTAPVATLL